jgi:hypothetical protein
LQFDRVALRGFRRVGGEDKRPKFIEPREKRERERERERERGRYVIPRFFHFSSFSSIVFVILPSLILISSHHFSAC